ncbi:MAG: hypothetical protein JJ895_12475 [Balneolaceae bacterium]|nr:hypothetical protein [Balneolaceae bacterium]
MKEEQLNKLSNCIERYVIEYPTMVPQMYIDQYLKLFKNYLYQLDMVHKTIANQIVDIGHRASLASEKSVWDSEHISVLLGLKMKFKKIKNTLDQKDNVFGIALFPKEPKKFSNNPGVESIQTHRAVSDWYNNVHLTFHKLAKDYIERTSAIFEREQVFLFYHKLRTENMMSVSIAHEKLIDWLNSYDKAPNQIKDEIGIQVFDADSFNQSYNRWKRAKTILS